MNTDTPNWGIEPVPERLRVLGGLDTALLWGNLGVALLVLVAGSVPRAGALAAARRCVAIVVGALIGNLMLGAAGGDRRRRARARDGAHARPARPAGLLPADRPQRRPVPRLGDLRADHHRRGSGGAVGRAFRFRGPGALDDRVRRRAPASWPCWGRSAFVRRFVRRFALWAVLASLLYLSWWALDGADLSAALAGRRRGRLVDRARASTSWWRSPSRGFRWPPTTPASRVRARARSSAPFVGYLVPVAVDVRCWARCSCSGADLSDPVAGSCGGRRGRLREPRSHCSRSPSTRPTRRSPTPTPRPCLAPEPPAERAAAAARRRGLGGRHGGRAHDRAAQLRGLPAPARLVLRAALRRPARRLAPRR